MIPYGAIGRGQKADLRNMLGFMTGRLEQIRHDWWELGVDEKAHYSAACMME